MNLQRHWLLLAILMASLTPTAGQQVTPTAGPANLDKQASIPDFSGIWRHGSLPWFIPPASGPGPVTNLSRRARDGVSDYNQLVGDYKNPIPAAVGSGGRQEETICHWRASPFRIRPTPAGPNQCRSCSSTWPMQMLQLPDQVVMLFNENHEVRRVHLNQPHPAKLTPSWHGNAVGRYDGDVLVIDTMGVWTDRPHAMIDLFGTPYSEKLHVVERYRLVDYDDAKDEMQRSTKENMRGGGPYNPNYKDKYLQVQFTIEDAGVFTTPWTASMIYLRDLGEFPEVVCAEGRAGFHNVEGAQIPTANRPDF
jgi:hypothetical protein